MAVGPLAPEPFSQSIIAYDVQRLTLEMHAALLVKRRTRNYKACTVSALLDKPRWEQAGEKSCINKSVLHVAGIKI